jgi:Zn-dependent protease
MRGTFQIAKLFGIPVQIHWSFALLIIWVIVSGYSSGLGFTGIAWLTLLMFSIFFCVVLHEYGHALTARIYGVGTKDIVLLPIGGVARLDRLPEKPVQELLVAAAGPLVNIAIAILLSPYFFWISVDSVQKEMLESEGIVSITFIPYLISLNIMLALFNLLPAFPMDGGRILRSLLAIRLGREKATKIAAIVGQIFAVAFVVASIYPLQSPVFALLGVFIFFSALQEYRSIKGEEALKKVKVKDVMKTNFTRLELDDTIRTVRAVVEIKKEKHFIVVNEKDKPIGVLHQLFLQEAEKQNDTDALVSSYMNNLFLAMDINQSFLEVMQLMHREQFPILPIVEEDKLVGVIDEDSINQYFEQLRKKK